MELPVIGQLIVGPHLGVEASLFGHVPEAEAISGADRLVVPGHPTGVGSNQTEYRPHRSCLSSTVWPEKAQHAPTFDTEGAAVQRDDIAETFVEVVDDKQDARG